MEIKLYSTHCPKCKVIEKKLKEKNVDFELIDNVDEVVAFGQSVNKNTAPLLKIGDDVLDFSGAATYLNNLEG